MQGPSTFLKHLYALEPSMMFDKLREQARDLRRTLPEQLAVLRKAVPAFVDTIYRDSEAGLNP